MIFIAICIPPRFVGDLLSLVLSGSSRPMKKAGLSGALFSSLQFIAADD